MRITNIQKKQLADIFIDEGLNILDFSTSGEYHEFKIKFKYEYFSFKIAITTNNKFELTILSVDNVQGNSFIVSWLDAISYFKRWAKEIAQDLNTPTGWETFQSFNFLNADFPELEQEFTEKEKYQVRENIIELNKRINSLELSEENQQIISQKLDGLSDKLDMLSKFDWKSLFLGTFASLIMTLGIPPDKNGMIWEYIKSTFNGLKIKG